jgi:hypothetical protein
LKPDEETTITIKGVKPKKSPIGFSSSIYRTHEIGFRAVGTVYPIGEGKLLPVVYFPSIEREALRCEKE